MDELTEDRVKTKEEFLGNILLGFRGLERSLLNRLDGKSFKKVFLLIREITSGEKLCGISNFQDQPSLMRRLTANNSEALKDLVYNSLQLSLSDLLKQMVAEIKVIKESDKKIEKLLRKTRHKVDSKSKNAKLTALQEAITQQWMCYKTTIYRQTVLLACLDEKLYQFKMKLGQKLKKKFVKYLAKTRKLAKSLQGDSSNSSGSDSSSTDSEIEEQKISSVRDKEEKTKENNEQKPPEEKDKKTSGSFSLARQRRRWMKKIVNPGVYKVTPWPIGDHQGPGITPPKPIDYAIFLALPGLPQLSSSVEANLSRASSADSLTVPVMIHKTTLVSPAPSILTVHSLTSDDEEAEQLGVTAPPNPPRETTPVKQLTEMINVYNKVVKAYKPKDKTELKLKVGQTVKQKRPANQFGMAYGWLKTSRVSLKKYGFFPVSHVVLADGK